MDVIKKIKQIHHQCTQHVDCTNCILRYKFDQCKVKELVYNMCKRPCDWNIEELEKILNG